MSTTITDVLITSDQTPHYAVAAAVITAGVECWHISWLPGDALSRNQAITAMTIAEVVAMHDVSPESRWWPIVEDWGGELGLTADRAVARLKAVAQ